MIIDPEFDTPETLEARRDLMAWWRNDMAILWGLAPSPEPERDTGDAHNGMGKDPEPQKRCTDPRKCLDCEAMVDPPRLRCVPCAKAVKHRRLHPAKATGGESDAIRSAEDVLPKVP